MLSGASVLGRQDQPRLGARETLWRQQSANFLFPGGGQHQQILGLFSFKAFKNGFKQPTLIVHMDIQLWAALVPC